MSINEVFEVFKAEAEKQGLLQTDVLYRRTDGQQSMKKRIKYVEGEHKEVVENKPMKSVHVIDLGEGCVLRVKKSNYERKEHLKFLLTLSREVRFAEIHARLQQVTGLRSGKNIHWCANGKVEQSHDYDSIAHYFMRLAEEAENEKVAKENPDLFPQPLVGDDNLLLEGW